MASRRTRDDGEASTSANSGPAKRHRVRERMAAFSAEWFKKKLKGNKQVLDLAGHSMGEVGARALVHELLQLPTLQQLVLSSTRMGKEGTVVLAGALGNVPGLKQLYLSHNDIGTGGAQALAGALEKVRALQKLDLSDNNMGQEGAVALAGALGKVPGLQKLFLRNNGIGVRGVQELAKALEKVPTLQKLDLSINNIGDRGVSMLARALVKVPSLQQLDLVSNHIGVGGAQALAGALEKVSTLQQLDLYCNNMGEEGAIALAGVLEKVPGLQELYLGHNSIGMGGAQALAGALERVPTLQNLDLGNNDIGMGGVKALAGALEKVSALQKLGLSFTGMGNEGAVALAGALGKVPGLQKLDMSDNNMGEEGVVALAGVLGKVSGLQELYLGRNNIGEGGALALAGALEKVPSLRKLNLTHTIIGDEGAVSLASVLPEGLLYLQVDNNRFKEEGLQAFVKVMAKRDPKETAGWTFSAGLRDRVQVLVDQYRQQQNLPECVTEKVKHGRLILCGDTNVGKTTLARSLKREEFRNTPSTQGAEVHSMQAEDGLAMEVWDFGGQHEYHALHAMVMPEVAGEGATSAMYALVCRAEWTREELASAAGHWLRFIASHTPAGAPRQLVVVFNKRSGNAERGAEQEAEVESWRVLYQERINILDVFTVDLSLDSARSLIQSSLVQKMATLLVDKKIPVALVAIQDRLEELKVGKSKLISLKEFEDHCIESGGGSIVHGGWAGLAPVLGYLHNVGLILFREDTVVVDVGWFCRDVVGGLLRPGLRLPIDSRGLVDVKLLRESLPEMEDEQWQIVVRILMGLRLCLWQKGGEEKLFVPLLADHEPRRIQALWNADPQGGTEVGRWKGRTEVWRLDVEDRECTELSLDFFQKFQVQLATDLQGQGHEIHLDASSLLTRSQSGRQRVLITYNYEHRVVHIKRLGFDFAPLTLAREMAAKLAKGLSVLGQRVPEDIASFPVIESLSGHREVPLKEGWQRGEHQPIRILSIDGGGIRGILPALILKNLEEVLGGPIWKFFDLVAGTSTGGILATMLFTPGVTENSSLFTPAEAVKFYKEQGSTIFSKPRNQLSQVARPKYSADGLEKLLGELLKERKLQETLKPLLVPAFSLRKSESVFFSSLDQTTSRYKLKDVCRATSAAPTYFPGASATLDHDESASGVSVADLEGRSVADVFIDGGVLANNPTSAAVAHVFHNTTHFPGHRRLEDVFVLSLGTGEVERGDCSQRANGGWWDWKAIHNLMMEGASHAAHVMVRDAFAKASPDKYLRLQVRLKAGEEAMDDASPENIEKLVAKVPDMPREPRPEAEQPPLDVYVEDSPNESWEAALRTFAANLKPRGNERIP